MSDLLERIEAAIDVVCNNNITLSVPARNTDVDVVLSECKAKIQALESENDRLKDCVCQTCNGHRLVSRIYRDGSRDDELCPDCMQDEWQPIATAPKDKTIIIFTKNENIWVVQYGQNLITGDEAFVVGTASDGDQMFIKLDDATHWQPLPQPPKEQS